MTIAGSHHGYFKEADEARVAADIEAARPDILLIAMTSPRKERFLSRWSRQLAVPVCHGVGGSFDVFAGYVQRAPERWQRMGLEWLYRVKQEPRRLWKRYFTTNSAFVAHGRGRARAAAARAPQAGRSRDRRLTDGHRGRGAPTNKPVVAYLLAASHSGSTLLAMLLASHPDVCTTGELKAHLARRSRTLPLFVRIAHPPVPVLERRRRAHGGAGASLRHHAR